MVNVKLQSKCIFIVQARLNKNRLQVLAVKNVKKLQNEFTTVTSCGSMTILYSRISVHKLYGVLRI